jgi:3',5'-cyclic-AMP phosphodiesterase
MYWAMGRVWNLTKRPSSLRETGGRQVRFSDAAGLVPTDWTRITAVSFQRRNCMVMAMDKSVLRITHFTDPHLYGSETESLRGIATLPALKATLKHAQDRVWPPDVTLVTGDIVQDDPSGYAQFRRLFGALGMPVLCIPGNHDDPAIMRRELNRAPFVVGGSFDLGQWRIVLLDSCIPGSASGRLSPESITALDEALATAPDRHCMVCLHHHPVPMDSRWLDRVGLENSAEFLQTIDRYRNVRAVVFGHVHQQYESVRKGVRLLATPSTCAQFLPHSPDFAVDRLPPAYRTLELRADGTLSTEVVWVEKTAGASRSVSSAA